MRKLREASQKTKISFNFSMLKL